MASSVSNDDDKQSLNNSDQARAILIARIAEWGLRCVFPSHYEDGNKYAIDPEASASELFARVVSASPERLNPELAVPRLPDKLQPILTQIALFTKARRENAESIAAKLSQASHCSTYNDKDAAECVPMLPDVVAFFCTAPPVTPQTDSNQQRESRSPVELEDGGVITQEQRYRVAALCLAFSLRFPKVSFHVFSGLLDPQTPCNWFRSADEVPHCVKYFLSLCPKSYTSHP
jgi:hypothetical protein